MKLSYMYIIKNKNIEDNNQYIACNTKNPISTSLDTQE